MTLMHSHKSGPTCVCVHAIVHKDYITPPMAPHKVIKALNTLCYEVTRPIIEHMFPVLKVILQK